MTPELMEQGAQRLVAVQEKQNLQKSTESGGRNASYSRLHKSHEIDTTHGRILYLEDVNVSFDGFKAINHLSVDIAPGELRCVIGPNGAGKTTMMDIITGKTGLILGKFFWAAPSICSNTVSLKSRNWGWVASFKSRLFLSN